jgi:sec-independent protein translocase protein TatC
MPDDFFPSRNAPDHPVYASFWGHIMELRKRLVRCIIVVILMMVLGFVFGSYLYRLFMGFADEANSAHWAAAQADDYDGPPMKNLEIRFMAQDISAPFINYFKIALIAGLALSMPFILYQVWGFVAPALNRRERRAFGSVLLMALVFFCGGIAFAHRMVLPYFIMFFSEWNASMGAENLLSMPEFVDNVLMVLLGFGVAFESPLVLMALAWAGIMSPAFLRRNWRWAILGAFVIGAVLTPPDPFTQLFMAAALLMLYVVSLGLMHLVWRSREGRPDAA